MYRPIPRHHDRVAPPWRSGGVRVRQMHPQKSLNRIWKRGIFHLVGGVDHEIYFPIYWE